MNFLDKFWPNLPNIHFSALNLNLTNFLITSNLFDLWGVSITSKFSYNFQSKNLFDLWGVPIDSTRDGGLEGMTSFAKFFQCQLPR